MSQDLTPEILAWNCARSHPQGLALEGLDGPVARLRYDRNPPEGVRPFHLIIWQYPCSHFFSRSPRLMNALMRVLYEP